MSWITVPTKESKSHTKNTFVHKTLEILIVGSVLLIVVLITINAEAFLSSYSTEDSMFLQHS